MYLKLIVLMLFVVQENLKGPYEPSPVLAPAPPYVALFCLKSGCCDSGWTCVHSRVAGKGHCDLPHVIPEVKPGTREYGVN